jgi:L-arabonate dehydrase
MASMAEALGMALPGNAAIPAADSRRMAMAEMAGRRAVEMAITSGPKPSQILIAPAFDNAIRTLMAIGGSTNAVIHLLALAGRVGVPLSLARFDELSRTTPFLLNLRPSGKYLMEDFFYAGGLPVVLKELLPLLHGTAPTVNGHTLADNVRDARCWNADVIRSLVMPIASEGGLAMLSGNLCPGGAHQGVGRVTAAAHPPRPRRGLRGSRRPAPAHRRSEPGDRRDLGAGPQARRPEGRAGDARVGRRTGAGAALEERA